MADARGKETKVLVVEDDLEINELLGEYLSLEGMKYLHALSGQAALQQAAAAHPDAIILDVMLPDIDGFQVAREVVAHRGTYDIPIIMLTCMNQDCDRQKGLASGAQQYMNKPFLPDDLLANVRQALEWKRNLPTRPPAGQMVISTQDPGAYHRGIFEMTRDLFTRTHLSDRVVEQIQTGFAHMADWALAWGLKHKRDPNLVVDYRLTDAAGQMASNGQAAAIHWQIAEAQPGLLEETVFKPGAGNVALAVSSNNEALQVSPLARWYHFLAKCGVTRFDKDTPHACVHLERALTGTPPSVPVVTIDGTRTPTRVRQEVSRRR